MAFVELGEAARELPNPESTTLDALPGDVASEENKLDSWSSSSGNRWASISEPG